MPQPIWVIAIVSGLIILLLLFGIPLKLLRFIGQGVVKLVIGALFLFVLNTIGNGVGLHVPINLITASVAGFLGIPGVFALTVIQLWII
ncbi:pro-sigmaK processing inhibitor BofA family protein [Fervidibacillus albus]|uniref:Pro-sigmaK processing inhibitor BofA family protein n=1 Tax=Fervidibacillus albus TaxID=2980026 RepID=A0A9E8LTT1_9BACI|nr:pro-sigmaK processing inhibitor BofA family protein [Fervidibacillus albus]WAA09508.1 pro-sigmaK processing inhibitor BofA family protein [Fervidibacillus albus]